jgi:transcriptional regulator with XRE-family HTH domain
MRRVHPVRITARLKALREDLHLSQGQLARSVGVHRSYITRIERGQRVPGLGLLYELAQHLGCRVEDLVAVEGSRNRPA